VKNVREFRGLDLLEFLSSLLQLLERFHDSLGHAAVSFLGATDDGELLARSDTLVTIFVIEADPE
jgi:hypothetical protein